MAIPYRLVPSEDSDSPGAYRAEVVFSGTCDIDKLTERIIDRYPPRLQPDIAYRSLSSLGWPDGLRVRCDSRQ